MKRISVSIRLILLFALILSSCILKDGDWKDNIKLSVRRVQFSAQADSVVITTKGSWWWVCDVTVGTEHFYDFRGIDPESENYSIKQNCFVVERRGKNTLFIKVDANPLSIERTITVGLEAGDYFDRVTITQNPN